MRFSLYILLVLLISCSSPDDPNPPGDAFGGIVTFTDSNLIRTGGYYAISIYKDTANPFTLYPLRSDPITITIVNHSTSSTYEISGIGTGNYFVGVTWVRNSGGKPILLGILGCDTSRSCSTYTKIIFPNFEGVSRFILSWTDTLKIKLKVFSMKLLLT